MSRWNCAGVLLLFWLWSCNKKTGGDSPRAANFSSTNIKLSGHSVNSSNYNTGVLPVIEFSFSSAIDKNPANSAFSFTNKTDGHEIKSE
jgi:hypothetical protein